MLSLLRHNDANEINVAQLAQLAMKSGGDQMRPRLLKLVSFQDGVSSFTQGTQQKSTHFMRPISNQLILEYVYRSGVCLVTTVFHVQL